MRCLLLVVLVICCAGTIALAQASGEGLVSFPADTDALVQQDSAVHELQPPDEVETTRAYQAEPLKVHRFDEGQWTKIVNGTNYNEEPVEAKDEVTP